MSILVIDLGTSSVRAAVVRPDATVTAEVSEQTLPDSPADGLVEFDAAAYLRAALDCARISLERHGPVDAVGITNQRATTIVWDRETGEPVAPAQGWQDLRTVGDCLVLAGEGFTLAPNLSATKLANILDTVDPDRRRDLCFGTPDSWIIWHLTEGEHHVTDLTNAAVWGMLSPDGTHFDAPLLERLRIPASVLPRILDSTGVLDSASALPGAPPIAGIVGDQQGSLVGQGCVRPGMAKITFGTGGMLDVCLGGSRPAFERRGGSGCFPIVAWREEDRITWGAEAVMLSAGSNVEWLVEDLGILESAASSEAMATSVDSSEGVVYVPALMGLGTPHWDYGARGALLGVTRGTTAAHITRAVLEGVANRGADLVEAARADTGLDLSELRVDGGMSRNLVFVQALADASGLPVEVSPVREATTVGAGLLAGLAIGTWSSWDEIGRTWAPQVRVEPSAPTDRDRWREAVRRAAGWYPELSALDF